MLNVTVVKVRPDGKMDLSIQRIGKGRFRDFADDLLDALREAPAGRLPFSDASSPDDIRDRFGVSKKTFKRALGTLYKQGLVRLTDTETILAEKR